MAEEKPTLAQQQGKQTYVVRVCETVSASKPAQWRTVGYAVGRIGEVLGLVMKIYNDQEGTARRYYIASSNGDSGLYNVHITRSERSLIVGTASERQTSAGVRYIFAELDDRQTGNSKRLFIFPQTFKSFQEVNPDQTNKPVQGKQTK